MRKFKFYINIFYHFIDNGFWNLTKEGRGNRKQLKNLQNIHAGKRCFILGNGPSLLKCDLSKLKSEITIASNANFLIWDQTGFQPSYLTVEDRLVAEDRKTELNSIKNVTKIFPRDLRHFLKLDAATLYINFLRRYVPFPKFSEKFDEKVYWGGTVSFLNLQLAFYLGCTEIYLIGFDHSYIVPSNIINHVITSEKDDVNHIHPNYFGKGYRWHDPNVDRMELAYILAKSTLENNAVKIQNATVGGKLETFQRIDYETLFKQAI
jgi:hypothetical protein